MFWTVLLSVVLVFILWEALRPDCPKRFKPGQFYYTKKWLFRILLWMNTRRKGESNHGKGEVLDRKHRGYGRSIRDPALLDMCQPLENDPMAIDTVYFNGFDTDGTFLALRVARKHNREGELWVWLNVPGVGFFQHPIMPDACIHNMEDSGYKALGAKLSVIEPLRTWRVTYNGLLRKGLCNDLKTKPKEFANVKMTFKWECFNDPFNFDTDLDNNLLADSIAREKWTKDFWTKLRGKHQTHYEQCGELSGTIEVEGHEPRQVHLKSFRDHTFGVRNWEMLYRYAIHYIWIEELGRMAMVAVLWMPGYISLIRSGYLMFANGETYPVTDNDLDIESLALEPMPPKQYSFSFKAAGEVFKVDLVAVVTPECYHYRGRTSRVLERFCTYSVNGRAARGLTEYHYSNPGVPAMTEDQPLTVTLLKEPCDIEDHKGKLTLTFLEECCQSSLLVGGKGAQLAMLTSIQSEVSSEVPRGFCLTLAAFECQLQVSPEIETSLQNIVSAIREDRLEDLQQLCSDAVKLLATCKMNQPVESQLTSQLQAVFGDNCQDVPLAVRSSAAGEDGGEASSAGQMETYLGVRGVDKLMEAVRKCWASAYTYQAVQYRRQHGQPIRTSMGVVIQEMIAAEVSGVIFTNDPVTGNPNKMVLDASFGLGEAVVSGKSTPDTVIVQRHYDNSLKILHKTLGLKGTEIQMSDSGGVEEVFTEMGDVSLCCLTDEQIYRLCNIAIRVEEYFGSPRDIEWAIFEEQIYLLQARPITTTDQETDEDIIHEFDTPLPSGQERVTLGNIGEMMPGVVTALTGSVFGRAVDRATSVVGVDFGGGTLIKHSLKSVISNCGRLFINLTWISQVYGNSLLYKKPALEMNLLGKILNDHTVSMIKSYGKEIKGTISRLYNLYKFFSVSNRKIRIADNWAEKLKTYSVGSGCDTAAELYRAIDKQLPDYNEVWETSVHKSTRSGVYGGVVMGIVSKRSDEWTIDNYSDVALLLSHCTNVYSAEVPQAIRKLAKAIVDCGRGEEFIKQTDGEAVTFLSSQDCPADIRNMYTIFMKRHGHRGIREAEFIEKSWRAEPEKLIRVVKAILQSKAYMETGTRDMSIDEAVAQLKSPLTLVGKLLLRKWIVKKARVAVGQREFGKSVAVEVSDRFKQAYWRLADLLFKEGRLPEKELMFHLTHYEIGQLIDTRSTKLVMKAVRRRKLLPVQAEIEFPRVCVGRPKPIEKVKTQEERKSSFTLTGMPVSRGNVCGTARVVRSLQEASQIQRGDILIVCYTDVGWSPYFPLISGLVTEMGGLVSHGAVVAREYGLPCVVNVPGATHSFMSGDSVRLDGTNGQVHKLEHQKSADDKII